MISQAMNLVVRLDADRRGIAMTEFALLAPVMMLLLMGAFELGHSLYMRSVLQGAVQKAGRDGGLESGTLTSVQAAIDNRIRAQVRPLNRNASVTFTRRYYKSFTSAQNAVAEPFTDGNSNGLCDNGEPFEDRNHNNIRDADGAAAGTGGAHDTVLYTATVSYPRMFPLHGFIGGSANHVVTAKTVMSNQPYAERSVYAAPVARPCPM
jgi:Flp pilus assembly protein TadG